MRPGLSFLRFRRIRASVRLPHSLGRTVREKLRNRKPLRGSESRPLRFHFAHLEGGQNRFVGHFAQYSLQRGIRLVPCPVARLAVLDKKKMPVTRLPLGIRAHQKQKQHSRKTEPSVRPI